jgi:hypothetical protein
MPTVLVHRACGIPVVSPLKYSPEVHLRTHLHKNKLSGFVAIVSNNAARTAICRGTTACLHRQARQGQARQIFIGMS